MNIAASSTPSYRPQVTATQPPASKTPKTEIRVKEEFKEHADLYNGSRNVGNKVSAAVIGVTGQVAGNVGLLLPTVGETYKNLWKAETIGPYAKTVGSIVALAGIPMVAAGAMIASPFLGLSEAFQDDSAKNGPLEADTTAKVAERLTSPDKPPATVLGKAIQNMREFGDKKLAPGEEPWDIPVDKIFKGALDGLNFLMVKVPVEAYKVGKKVAIAAKDGAIEGAKLAKQGAIESAKFVHKYAPKLAGAALAGVVSTAIAGPAGLVIGMGVGATLAARDIYHAVTDSDRSIGSRIGGVAKTLAYLPVGPVMAGISVKENFARSFAEGWDGHPVEAIKTTGKAVIAKAKEALNASKEIKS